MLLYIMLKGKSTLIFYLPFYCVQIHINKILSFRKWESRPLIIFYSSDQADRLCIQPTERTKNVCQESQHVRQWQQHRSKATAVVGRWPWMNGKQQERSWWRPGSTVMAMSVPPDANPALRGLWMPCNVPALLPPEQNVWCPCEAHLKGSLVWEWVFSFWDLFFSRRNTDHRNNNCWTLLLGSSLAFTETLTAQEADSHKKVT